MTPDPHEQAVEARPGIWHKDGPLAQLEAMADWADQIASQRADNLAWETAHKIARNIRAVLPHLEQERPDPDRFKRAEKLMEVMHGAGWVGDEFDEEAALGVIAILDRVPQDKPPSREINVCPTCQGRGWEVCKPWKPGREWMPCGTCQNAAGLPEPPVEHQAADYRKAAEVIRSWRTRGS